MSVIKGENAILYWKVDGIYLPIACMESCNVTTNTELSETSTVQTGIYRTYRGNRNTWTVSAQGLCSFDQNHPHVKLRLLQQSMTAVPISFIATDDNGITENFSGNVLITTLPTDSSAGDFYKYSIEAVGTGEYFITDIPIDPNECCQDAWEYYTANGTENFSITIVGLIGRTIAGRIYRDGVEYRPSGVDHDGTGIPSGKQFRFEQNIGKISFDSNILPLALGEQVDIPYNMCGSIGSTCDIQIDNVMAEPNTGDGDKFYITFEPVVDGITTVPDSVSVRYSTDDGETWQIPDSISYDPLTDYNIVIINDALPIDIPYLFEVTPVCNGANGTAGTGGYYPCIAAAFTGSTTLPDGIVSSPYFAELTLSGSAPFSLNIIAKPAWMEIDIVSGNKVTFTGTPTDEETGVTVSLEVDNCVSDTLPFSDTIDITLAEVTFANHNICVEGLSFTSFEIHAAAGTLLEFELTMAGFFNWSNTVGSQNVNISASITLPAGLLPASISDYRPYTGQTGLESVNDVSPVSVFVTVPVGGIVTINALANIENAGSGYIMNGTFKIISVDGNAVTLNEMLCVGFSTGG